ncbi:MAG: cytochrome c3 family protein [Candidatus Tectomicrobia bacterium]|nr:cytochrome c3 family protein [Candidatus Tectomicrobia bacterium]
MKQSIITAMALVLVLGLIGAAVAGITGTKHDLRTANNSVTIRADTASNAIEICAFCHTPHGAETTGNGPLWNKNTSGLTSFNVYSGSPTMDTTPATLPTGVSLVCLSCHDGSLAIDSMRNAPGSGGFNPSTTSPYTMLGTTNDLMPAGITRIGATDGGSNTGQLQDDHPVSMTYAGNIGGSGAKDAKMRNAVQVSGGAQYVVPGNDQTTPSSGTDIDGYVKLYDNKVECASCHNPHGTEVSGANLPLFLRRTNENSTLCLTCHIK